MPLVGNMLQVAGIAVKVVQTKKMRWKEKAANLQYGY